MNDLSEYCALKLFVIFPILFECSMPNPPKYEHVVEMRK